MKTTTPLFALALTAAAAMTTACGRATMTMHGDGARRLAAPASGSPRGATDAPGLSIDGAVGGRWAVSLGIAGADGADIVRLTLTL